MKKVIFFLQIVIIVFLSYCPAQAEFFYEPTVIILAAPGGRGDTAVKITNPMGRATTVLLTASEWEITQNNRMVYKKYDEKDPNSLLNFIKISPRKLTLAPKQEKMVRIACNLPAGFENKEYKITLNMTEPGAERKKLETEDVTREFGLVVNKEIKASTYIWKGQNKELKSNLQLAKTSAIKNKVTNEMLTAGFAVNYKLVYENTGNIHDRRTIGIRLFDATTGALVHEVAKVGILVAFPTKAGEPITFKSAFTVPKEIDPEKNYDIEFVLVPRFAYKVEALDPMKKRAIIKSEKIRI